MLPSSITLAWRVNTFFSVRAAGLAFFCTVGMVILSIARDSFMMWSSVSMSFNDSKPAVLPAALLPAPAVTGADVLTLVAAAGFATPPTAGAAGLTALGEAVLAAVGFAAGLVGTGTAAGLAGTALAVAFTAGGFAVTDTPAETACGFTTALADGVAVVAGTGVDGAAFGLACALT